MNSPKNTYIDFDAFYFRFEVIYRQEYMNLNFFLVRSSSRNDFTDRKRHTNSLPSLLPGHSGNDAGDRERTLYRLERSTSDLLRPTSPPGPCEIRPVIARDDSPRSIRRSQRPHTQDKERAEPQIGYNRVCNDRERMRRIGDSS